MLRTFNRHRIKKVRYPSPCFYMVPVDCAEELGKKIIAAACGQTYGQSRREVTGVPSSILRAVCEKRCWKQQCDRHFDQRPAESPAGRRSVARYSAALSGLRHLSSRRCIHASMGPRSGPYCDPSPATPAKALRFSTASTLTATALRFSTAVYTWIEWLRFGKMLSEGRQMGNVRSTDSFLNSASIHCGSVITRRSERR